MLRLFFFVRTSHTIVRCYEDIISIEMLRRIDEVTSIAPWTTLEWKRKLDV